MTFVFKDGSLFKPFNDYEWEKISKYNSGILITQIDSVKSKEEPDNIDEKIENLFFSLRQLIFEGKPADNSINGDGIVRFPSGASYKGEFLNDKYNGAGVYTFQNGYNFMGQFKDDIIDYTKYFTLVDKESNTWIHQPHDSDAEIKTEETLPFILSDT